MDEKRHDIRTLIPTVGREIVLPDPETQKLLALGKQRGWDFAILGRAPMLETPIRLNDWLLVPAHQDSSEIPDRAKERLQTIFSAGLRPQGFIVVHETTKLLPVPPAANEPDTFHFPKLSPRVRSGLNTAGSALGLAATGLVVVSGVAVAVAVAAAAVAIMVLPVLIGTAIMVDPILIAVTEDEYWVEIDRWDIEVER